MYLSKSKIESTVFTSGQKTATISSCRDTNIATVYFVQDTNITPEASFHKIAMGFTNDTLIVAYLVFEKLHGRGIT